MCVRERARTVRGCVCEHAGARVCVVRVHVCACLRDCVRCLRSGLCEHRQRHVVLIVRYHHLRVRAACVARV